MALRPLPLLTLVFLLTLLRVSEGRKYLRSFAGPYWIQMMKYYSCPPEEAPNPWANFTFRALNTPRSHTDVQRVTFRGEIRRNVTDALLTVIDGEVWANNQWKKNGFPKMSFPNFACSVYKKFFPDVAVKVFGMDLNSDKPCVVPVGEYARENIPINWTIPDVPQFIYGLYRVKNKFYDGKTPVICVLVEGRFIPRPT